MFIKVTLCDIKVKLMVLVRSYKGMSRCDDVILDPLWVHGRYSLKEVKNISNQYPVLPCALYVHIL